MTQGRRAIRAVFVLAGLGALVVASAAASADDGPAAGTSGGVGGTRLWNSAAGRVIPTDIEDVEHMCALLTACERVPLPPGLVPRDVAGCTRALYAELASASSLSFSLTLRECGLKSNSCTELRACALRGAKPTVCAGRGKGGQVELCDADGRAVTCLSERITLVRDCPRGGEQCVVRDGHAACALGGCDSDSAPSCSKSGTRILECKHSKLLSLDCSAFGLRCVSTADGPKCAAADAPACQDGAGRCEGTTSISCWHGHEARVECGAAGLECSSPQGSDAGAAPPVRVGACTVPTRAPGDGACDPSAPARCEGSTLTWCAFGRPRSYLCKAMGLQRCVVDERLGARCAP